MEIVCSDVLFAMSVLLLNLLLVYQNMGARVTELTAVLELTQKIS